MHDLALTRPGPYKPLATSPALILRGDTNTHTEQATRPHRHARPLPRVSVSDRPSVAGIPPRLLRSLLPLVTSRPHSRNPRVSCVRVFTRTYRPARLASRARLAFRLFSGPSELPCSVLRSSRDSRLASHPACIARANIPTNRLWIVNSSSRTERIPALCVD